MARLSAKTSGGGRKKVGEVASLGVGVLPAAVNGVVAGGVGVGGGAANEADYIGQHLCDRVRDLRREKDWTLEKLAAISGVSRSMLSQIERNEANPTIGVAYRIAKAFNVSLATLVDAPDHNPVIDVIRLDDRAFHFRSSKECRVRTVTPSHLEKDVEFLEVAIKAGSALRSVPHFSGTREFVVVQQGAVRIHAGEERADLQKGDSAHYPADVQHAIENIGKGEAVIFLVEIYRRQGS